MFHIFVIVCCVSYCVVLQKEAKRDPELEAQAIEWMQAVTGEPFPDGVFEEALKDGTYLCK